MTSISCETGTGRSLKGSIVATAIALSLALVLLAPATAAAKTFDHSGTVIGDEATMITFKVRTKAGKPSKVLDFAAKGIITRCDGAATRFNFTVLVPLKINDRGNFKARLPGDNGAVLRISGKTKGSGRTAVGNVKSNRFNEGEMSCQTPKQRFKTTS